MIMEGIITMRVLHGMAIKYRFLRMIYKLCLILLFMVCRISFAQKLNVDTFGNYAKYYKYVYQIDNKNRNKIGYIETGDESIGVKALCTDGKFIYLTDVVHSSVKKIDFSTGSIVKSVDLQKNHSVPPYALWLRDIYYFGKEIVVITDFDSVYVLDTALNLVRTVYSGKSFIEKYVIMENDHGIYVDIDSSYLDNGVKYSIYMNMYADSIKIVHSIFEANKGINISSRYNYHSIRAYDKDNMYYLEIGNSIFKLKEKFSEVNSYFAFNACKSNNLVCYFSSTKNEFVLFVYVY